MSQKTATTVNTIFLRVAAKTPPNVQLAAAQELIGKGVDLNKIKPLYKLVGHRQVTATKCPGDKLQDVIKHWPHFQAQAH